MKILAIETSCDETAAAVTEGTHVLSSIKITQEIHSQWGGVVPSLARRDHEQNIDWVVQKTLDDAGVAAGEIGAIAVTQGPGLAIALEVGIKKAKDLCRQLRLPLVAVNHVEGHVLSALVDTDTHVRFPCAAIVISGGHTQVILVKKIGEYQILAESLDDDIGEAIDKGARMLGLTYPGGPALEKLAALGNPKVFSLPRPMAGREDNRFSYAGLKSAFYRLVQTLENLNETQKADLAAVYQSRVFEHLVRITTLVLTKQKENVIIRDLLVGGGVAANATLRTMIEHMGRQIDICVHYPTNMILCTDNAAMIGVAAGYMYDQGKFVPTEELDRIDRKPRMRVDET